MNPPTVLRHTLRIGSLAVALWALTAPGCAAPRTRSPIEGVWRVAQIRQVTPSAARTDRQPPPSLVIFTARHYSLAWTSAPFDTRPRSAEATEKAAGLTGVAFDGGTWEQHGSRLVTHPAVASRPALSGGRVTWECRASADTLWLVQTEAVSGDGEEDPADVFTATTLTLVRAE